MSISALVTSERCKTLLRLLSRRRLSTYLSDTDNDIDKAIGLYEWSARVSAEYLRTAAAVEVIVRNAIDEQLVGLAQERGWQSWMTDAPLDRKARADLQAARRRATRFGRPNVVDAAVIPELGLGFWRYLVTRRYYTSLWVPGIAQAFPYATVDLAERQREVDRAMKRLHLLRNRAAHHEPIYRVEVQAEVDNAVTLAGWVHPVASAWVRQGSDMAALLRRRPV